MNKICSKCKKTKLLSNFRKGNGRFGVSNWCKECMKNYEQSSGQSRVTYITLDRGCARFLT